MPGKLLDYARIDQISVAMSKLLHNPEGVIVARGFQFIIDLHKIPNLVPLLRELATPGSPNRAYADPGHLSQWLDLETFRESIDEDEYEEDADDDMIEEAFDDVVDVLIGYRMIAARVIVLGQHSLKFQHKLANTVPEVYLQSLATVIGRKKEQPPFQVPKQALKKAAQAAPRQTAQIVLRLKSKYPDALT